jgi:hypothetical protein
LIPGIGGVGIGLQILSVRFGRKLSLTLEIYNTWIHQPILRVNSLDYKKQPFDCWNFSPPGRARFGRVVWTGGRSVDRVFSSSSADMDRLLLEIKAGEAVDVLDSCL